MPIHPKVFTISAWNGVDNVNTPEATSEKFLKVANNVDIDKTGNLSKRPGYRKVDSADYKSIFSSLNGLGCYAVRNKELVQVYPNYTHRVLKSNLKSTLLSFTEVDGKIYFVSEYENGMIENGELHSFGIPKNPLSPTLSAIGGTLPSGTYQVAFTLVNSKGIESGTGVASAITLGDNSGLSFSLPSVVNATDIIYCRYYISTTDGKTLFYSGMGLLGSTIKIEDLTRLSNPLRTFNLDCAPNGHIVTSYRGRAYIAQDNVLWYSEPYQYQHFNLQSNYFEFSEKIRAVMAVDDGIWIAADKIYYLSGHEPDKTALSVKEYVKVVPGTEVMFSGSYLHMDNTPVGYKWLVTTDLGIFCLFNQGLVINLTSTSVDIDRADSGTAMFLRYGGMNRYLTILNKNFKWDNKVATDLVETRVIQSALDLNNRTNMSSVGDIVTTTITRNGITII